MFSIYYLKFPSVLVYHVYSYFIIISYFIVALRFFEICFGLFSFYIFVTFYNLLYVCNLSLVVSVLFAFQ